MFEVVFGTGSYNIRIDTSELGSLGYAIAFLDSDLMARAIDSGVSSGAFRLMKRLKKIGYGNEFGWPSVSPATLETKYNPAKRGRQLNLGMHKSHAPFGALKHAILYRLEGKRTGSPTATIGLIPDWKPSTPKVRGVLSQYWAAKAQQLQAGFTYVPSFRQRRYFFVLGMTGLATKRVISTPARPFFGKAAGILEADVQATMQKRIAARILYHFEKSRGKTIGSALGLLR